LRNQGEKAKEEQLIELLRVMEDHIWEEREYSEEMGRAVER
jgi:hypothetical protein